MSRYRGPVTRLSRKLGLMLFQNGQSKIKSFQKKGYKPGEHGQKRFGQMSEYSKQLQEKQKARFLYGISEKQSHNYYKLATKTLGMTGVNYMTLLERRLDNVIYRAGLAKTRAQARQIVGHGMVKLNGRRVKTPSITVKTGDKFEIQEKSRGSKLFEGIDNTKFKPPKWVKSDLKKLAGEITALPEKDDIEQAIDNQLITEFYSK